ncbi:alpha/beta-Hydrolases superfamily protein [Actinidia rufa]|uniref:Alpha/beta-Hydrolases superfamily protein n=1 Tax=Actinidia rufa TaxID=165716 RepID=A0A7J0GWZ7_9ERIC|nr:alpha/beta-Hydrolases superfamily protein [Actinidia rufa]
MQMSSTLPVHNLNLFQTKSTTTASFKCRGFGSPLNPSTRSVPSWTVKAVATTGSTRKHLSNLEKLLQKQSQPEPPDLSPVVENVGGEGPLENRGKGLLEGLNLAQIWPEVKPEEMSPGRMSSLRRLLSMSQEYSPRNNLASRWREYHGSGDWEGLLDPLDENLRREVVRYGEFVQAAYRCFHSNPSTSTNEPPSSPRHVALPDRSYRVTKSLYATSERVGGGVRGGLRGSKRDCTDGEEGYRHRPPWNCHVSRVGRELQGPTRSDPWPKRPEPWATQSGMWIFKSTHKTRGAQVPSLAESVVQEIQRLMALYKGETLSITVTGHSLGAALALLVADELSTCAPEVPPVAVFSFGGPRVGNRGFANRIHSKNVKVLRIVNSQDVITRVPGMFVSEDLDRTLRNSSAARVLNVLDNTMPWAYWHVGTELRVDTKMSPFLKPNADVACCHDLEAYLHLVDGFLSSNCPFRANAKRSLVKLLNEQKPNVKKLYTKKAKTLRLNIDREGLPMSNCLPSPS